MLVLVPASSTQTRPPAPSMAALKNKRTVRSSLNMALTRTVRAVTECRTQQAGQLTSDAGLDDFMSALYRVCHEASVWRSHVLLYLAPVIFCLDAEMQAEVKGDSISAARLSAAIQMAQQAGMTVNLTDIESLIPS